MGQKIMVKIRKYFELKQNAHPNTSKFVGNLAKNDIPKYTFLKRKRHKIMTQAFV